ncbi:MAG: hypothetical protein ACJA2S_004868 [Cyclobacteriaceae bacterium]
MFNDDSPQEKIDNAIAESKKQGVDDKRYPFDVTDKIAI